ncbi:MAG TPA: nucleoside deaminase [Hyphomonadaceae bacterium]|jgi:tRNA(Arg) A34 adenosine deaminase TadA|nr:nucleoside deaminase [Hyphomonadaceae bacterium]
MVTSAEIRLPDWLSGWPLPAAPVSDETAMVLAVQLSRENVARRGGGPFGAVLRDDSSGEIVSVGVNLVSSTGNPVLHAEVTALQLAQLGEQPPDSKGNAQLVRATLFTSCEPCIMCLGASHWAGLHRIVCAAHREDAESVGFNEGEGCDQLRAGMTARGVRYERGLMRAEAAAVLREYASGGGRIYGPAS